MPKERISWIDVTKLIGIFCIYLGHCGDAAGPSYQFVFTFHVPLFFFISGCMSNYDYSRNLVIFFYKRVRQILIPFYMFSILSIILNFFIINPDSHQLYSWLLIVIKGCIRNHFFSGSLWFLSCLFVLEILFKLIKYIKNRFVIFTISLIIFMTSYFMINPRPVVYPHFIYNIDSMMYYIIYYALGFCIYPYLLNLFEFDRFYKKSIGGILFVFSFIYSIFLYKGRCLDGFMFNSEKTIMLVQIYRPIVISYGVLFISKFLDKISFLSTAGKETLYLCGNEFIIKTLVPILVSLFGLQITIINPLYCYIYCIILLIINIRIVIPVEKKCINYIKSMCYEFMNQ